MKKIITITSLILFCTSCFVQEGQLVNGQCRPKNPNFKLLKTPFRETEELVFKKIYLSDGNIKSFGIGFYPDGHLVYFVSEGNNNLKVKDIIGKNWSNSMYVGYWRVEKDEIKVQYFVCGNSGVYINKIGMIKGNAIFLERDCGSSPFKREKCFDKYILSDMSLGNVSQLVIL